MLINGQNFTQADIKCPTRGQSEIVSRASANPAYQIELLQTSIFYLVTKTGKVAVKTEARVFRFQNGEWSLWDTDGYDIVTEKITDLTLEREISPSSIKLRAVQRPWVDGKGENKYLGLEFHMDEKPYWTMHHKIKQGEEETVQGTRYGKIPEDRQEGWLGWLAEGVKVGFVGTKGYLKV